MSQEAPAYCPLGSYSWWKEVDSLAQRRTSKTHSIAALDDENLAQLNNYFGTLCTDDTYVNPSPIAIGSNINIPEITEHEFWNVLRKIKRTAIGPDLIPF